MKALVSQSMYDFFISKGVSAERMEIIKPLPVTERKSAKVSYRDLEYKNKKRFNKQ